MGCAASKPSIPSLPPKADAEQAAAYTRRVCGVDEIRKASIVTLLRLLKKNQEYATLELPNEDTQRDEYAGRMFMLADVDRDGLLSDREFELFWRHLPTSKAASVLGERFGAKMVAPADHFKFGSREDW